MHASFYFFIFTSVTPTNMTPPPTCHPQHTQSPEWVEERLQGVQLLLPDLPHPEEMQRDVILQMLVQYQQLPMRIVGLRQLLPKVNLSRMFINLPRLLVEPPLDWLEQHLQYVKYVCCASHTRIRSTTLIELTQN